DPRHGEPSSFADTKEQVDLAIHARGLWLHTREVIARGLVQRIDALHSTRDERRINWASDDEIDPIAHRSARYPIRARHVDCAEERTLTHGEHERCAPGREVAAGRDVIELT